MSTTQKQGVITLIPKGNKPRNLLKHWRQISLLNTTYKLLSGCIANRIKPALTEIIHENQTGFLKGRFIGENSRILYDTMSCTEINNKPGLALFVDFEMAFDSVSWRFIQKK